MEGEEALALETRNRIYKLIKKSPGLHFREIQRRLNIAVGSLQYHLGFLEKKHLIKSVKQGKFVRYFSTRDRSLKEKETVLSLLRKESTRKIILFLQTRKRGATNLQIAKNIGLTPSTTSFHLKSLLDGSVLQKKRRGRKTYFSLIEPEQTAELMVSYRKSFLDELVDNFVEVWQEI